MSRIKREFKIKMHKISAIRATRSVLLMLVVVWASSVNSQTPQGGPTKPTKSIETSNKLISNVKQLTMVGSKTGEGYYSADGKKMVLQSDRQKGNPFYQIYLMDLVSGDTQLISTGKGKTTCAWIDSTNSKVLYSSTHLDPQLEQKIKTEYESQQSSQKNKYSWSYDEYFDIFVKDLRSGKLQQITKEKGYDAEASFSSDGKSIVFASNRLGYSEKLSPEDEKLFTQDPSYMMELFKMDANGKNLVRLTESKGYDGGPFFSADGKKITWRRFTPNGQIAEIYVMNSDGSEQKPVTQLNAMSWAPFFHPSGDYIVFTSNINGYSNFELYIVDVKGESVPVRVSFIDGFDGLPTFSPQGDTLSWTHRNEKGESQIYTAHWDDLLARKLLKLEPSNLAVQSLNSQINEGDIRKLIGYFSDDVFKGRKTGSAEEKVYAISAENLLKSMGLKPLLKNNKFHQEFEFISGVTLGTENLLKLGYKSYSVGQDYIPSSLSQSGSFEAMPIVFAGYGLKAPAGEKVALYDSYAGLDVKNKWVLILRDLPMVDNVDKRHHWSPYSRLQHKITLAKQNGAKGVIIIQPTNIKTTGLKYEGASTEGNLPVLFISQAVASDWVKDAGGDLGRITKELDSEKPFNGLQFKDTLTAKIDLKFEKSIARNVLARLGSDVKKPTLLIGAHIDHLGMGDMGSSLARADELPAVHGGADDNASGIAGIIELAHHFAKIQKKLNFNLVFAFWSGEEVGLIGSQYFVKNYTAEVGGELNKNIKAYLNMDMIGRLRESLIIQGTGSASEWKSIIEKLNTAQDLKLSLQDDPYQPTDSMALYMAGLPSLTFFTGAHAEYHTPRDSFELINYKGQKEILDFMVSMLTYLGTPSVTLNYVKAEGSQKKMENRSFRLYLGTIPDYSQEGVKGVRIGGVTKNGPAEKAGLEAADVIVELDKMKIENLYDYVYTLQSMKPNQKTTIKVKRKGEVRELEITPLLKE